MSIPQGIEQPPPPEVPPYVPELIHDRITGHAYPVIHCEEAPAVVRGAAPYVRWRVTYVLPNGCQGYTYVDEHGFAAAAVLGPDPLFHNLYGVPHE